MRIAFLVTALLLSFFQGASAQELLTPKTSPSIAVGKTYTGTRKNDRGVVNAGLGLVFTKEEAGVYTGTFNVFPKKPRTNFCGGSFPAVGKLRKDGKLQLDVDRTSSVCNDKWTLMMEIAEGKLTSERIDLSL